MNATEVLISAHTEAQRAAMEARDVLRDAEDAVRHATATVAHAEATVEYIAMVLRTTNPSPVTEFLDGLEAGGNTNMTTWAEVQAEAERVVSLAADDQYLGGQELADMILNYRKDD